MARDRRQVTASMRSPPHEARASPRPRSSEIRDSLDCITLLRTMDAHLPAISASAEFRFPSRGLDFEKGQPSFFSWYQPLWSAKISGVSSAEHCFSPFGSERPPCSNAPYRRAKQIHPETRLPIAKSQRSPSASQSVKSLLSVPWFQSAFRVVCVVPQPECCSLQ